MLDTSITSQQIQNSASSVDLSSQLQVVNLGYLGQESNIYELASTYVDFSFLPLFTDFKTKTGQQTLDPNVQSGASGLDLILKELSSLKMHLAQARQNLAIPRVELAVDPEVKRRVEQARQEKRAIKVQDFEDIMGQTGDKSLTNRLEANINSWLKDIRKVTQLEHLTATGTAI